MKAELAKTAKRYDIDRWSIAIGRDVLGMTHRSPMARPTSSALALWPD
jgi:hypothetical protein